MRNKISVTVFIFVLVLAISAMGGGLSIALQTSFTNISRPVYATNAKDGTNRLFVLEQPGVIKVIQPGQTAATTFLDLSSRVTILGGIGDERGLLGLTFHPQFETNSFFFVFYTQRTGGATVVARYKATNNNTAGDLNSEIIILTVPQPFSNHNGGTIEFGPDNNLYIGMGDGGSGNDPGNRAQNIDLLLGKFLRITPSLLEVPGPTLYTNPPDNPYVGIAGADEIYAVGLRNPYRWSFDRGGINQLWAGDVGQGAIEEFDIIERSRNYGWRVYEGTQCTNLDPGLCIPGNFTPPVGQYARAGGRCSIIGGHVYRGTRGTFPNGAYIYADYCTGEIFMWRNNLQTTLLDTPRSVTSLGEDESGELYLVGIGGTVERIINNNPIINNGNADFDGDSRTDVSVFRPSTGVWYSINSSNSTIRIQQFGADGDIPTPEDFDGDNRTDIGVFRPSNGVWYYFRSSDSTVGITQFGLNGDIPSSGDFDGDARADLAVFRPSNGVWYVLRSSNAQAEITQFGLTGDIPVVGDYNGDGRDDIGVFRPSNGVWYRFTSGTADFSAIQFGSNGDVPVSGDYDGDGREDTAVYRPTNGGWYILNSNNNSVTITQFGLGGDLPVAGDYDGDGRANLAVFRPSNGVWYILQPNGNTNILPFGTNGDLPAPAYDRP